MDEIVQIVSIRSNFTLSVLHLNGDLPELTVNSYKCTAIRITHGEIQCKSKSSLFIFPRLLAERSSRNTSQKCFTISARKSWETWVRTSETGESHSRISPQEFRYAQESWGKWDSDDWLAYSKRPISRRREWMICLFLICLFRTGGKNVIKAKIWLRSDRDLERADLLICLANKRDPMNGPA